VSTSLITEIFDTDSDLHIDIKERTELAFAYLSNTENIERKVKNTKMRLSDWMDDWDGLTELSAKQFLSDLWLLTSKWPVETKLQSLVYQYIPANDKTKATVYKACTEAVWRRVILEYCDGSETETIALGKKDPDDGCRETAFSKVKYLNPAEFKEALDSRDEHVLRGLLQNRSFYIATRLVNRYLVSQKQLEELGVEDWFNKHWADAYEFKKLLGRGLKDQLRRMIFERSDYLWEKKFPTAIFTALRNKLWDRMKEFNKHEENFDWQFRELSNELEKRFPPVSPDELFLESDYAGDVFVGHKIDFLAKKLFYYDSLIKRGKKLIKMILLVAVIWFAWKLFGLVNP
jgi:hypothetical protein